MKKRIISFLLISALCAGTAVPVSAFESDLSGHWAKDSFERLEKMGIIKGYDDGYYRPDGKITRAEFFSIVNRVCNASKNKGSSFSDVENGAWYKNAVDYAYTAGYASGYEDGTFRPDSNITRAEAAAVIYKAFGGDKADDADFTDRDNIPSWAKDAVETLTGAEFFSGYEDGTFRPEGDITRAETAAVFDRLAGEIYVTPGTVSDVTFEKNLIVGATDIIFRNAEFKGDVYLSAGISGGEIRFVNCNIEGKVIFAGRDDAAVVFENSVCSRTVVSSSSHTSVIASGTSEIAQLVIRSECDVMEMSAEIGFEKADIYAYAELSGDFEYVKVFDGSGFRLISGEIKECVVSAPSKPEIDILGKTGSFTAETACILNGKSVSAGYTSENAGASESSDVNYSYTLSRFYSDDFETEPVIGGSGTEVQTGKTYQLSGLDVSAGKLIPSFSPDITSYSVIVPDSTGSVVVIPQADESSECRAEGKEIGAEGYTVSGFEGSSKSVNIDIYSGLVKKNTYTVTVTGYGPSNTGIAEISADIPSTCNVLSDGVSYELTLTGDISYTGNTIPVKITVNTVNEKSSVSVNGNEGNTYTVDLFEKRTAVLTVKVTSEDGENTCDYNITVSRPIIPELDNPDSIAVDSLISDPQTMTAEALAKSKILQVNENNLEEYKSYLAKLVYKAEGKDVYGKQEIIQSAVYVVNEWKGKKLRVEPEDFWTGTINEFADDTSQKYCIGIKSFTIQLDNSVGQYSVPEGTYTMTVRWGSKYESNADGNPVLVNGVTVYNGSLPKTWLNSAVTGKTLKTTQLADTVIDGIKFNDTQNTVTFTETKSNLVLDYFDLEMVFD